jgi:hypothetical protein
MAYPLNPSNPATAAALSPRRLVVEGDVWCLLCGDVCGVIELAEERPLGVTGLFRPRAGTESTWVRWRQLRCPRCGGSTIVSDLARRQARPPADEVDWSVYRPRRGRPSKRMVELRQKDDQS